MELRSHGRLAAAATLLAAVLSLLAGCARSPTEQALRERIDAMQAAVENGEVSSFMAGVHEDFAGPRGMDRQALRNLVRIHVLRHARIGATLGPVSVEMAENTASVEFRAVLTGGQGGLIPERAQGYRVESQWRFEDGEWRVLVAEWEPVL